MDKIVRIYKESDLDFEYKLTQEYVSVPFKFTFFTTDLKHSFYEASFDGVNYNNCSLSDSGDSIVFHLNGPLFYLGNVRIRKEFYIDSASFEDGVYNAVDVEKTNVYIVEEGSTATSVVYQGSLTPNLDYATIENRVEVAMNTLSDSISYMSDFLDSTVDANDTMNSLIETAQGWEGRISDLETGKANISDVPTIQDLDNEINAILTVVLPSYITSDELSSCSYITMDDVSACGYLTQHQDISDKVNRNELDSYVTKSALNSAGYISSIPSEYVTQAELSANSYLTQHQDLSNYATKSYVQGKISSIPEVDLTPYATKSYVQTKINAIPEPDLTPYATKNYVQQMAENIVAGDVDLTRYVSKTELSQAGYLTAVPSEYITQAELSANSYLTQHQSLSDYPTFDDISGMGYLTQHQSLDDYATKSYVQDKVDNVTIDTSTLVSKVELSECGYISSIPSEYVTQAELSANSYLTQHQDLSDYPTFEDISGMGYLTQHQSLSDYVTKTDINNAGYISSIPSEYITQAELSANSYLTQHQSLSDYPTFNDISGMGYLTSVPSEYITQAELSANSYLTQHQSLADYVTKNDLSNAGYLTSVPSEYITQAELSANSYLTQHQDLSGYVTKSLLNTYITFGGGYSDQQLNLVGDGVDIRSYDSLELKSDIGEVYGPNIIPHTNNTYNLGSNEAQWAYTYTKNLILDSNDVNSIFPTYSYVENSIQNHFDAFIWTGTQAQYNLLDNYTSYQLYLIAQN